jgi:DNA-binding winged helix-turn-helix (wHTH) protein
LAAHILACDARHWRTLYFRNGMTRIRLEGFVLDTEARQLLRAGRPVHLAPKALELLELLVDKRPNAVSKAVIHDKLWPETFVAEVNLPVLIHRLREALEDDPRDPRFVRTVTRFGYAFCGSAWSEADGPPPVGAFHEHRVVLGNREIVLRQGDNLLGRTYEAAVRVDQTSVSRRHAIIRVSDSGATIEDCGSKNGTFRGNERVNEAVPLQDGDRILLGAALLIFRSFRRDADGMDTDPAARPTTPLIPPDGPVRSHV